MIKKIAIDGLLSFEKFELELRNLNVLIGPNGSGKSNLIEVFSLLQALPTDIGEPIRRGGGIGEWIRKTERKGEGAQVDAWVSAHGVPHTGDMEYHLHLRSELTRYAIAAEWAKAEEEHHGARTVVTFFSLAGGRGSVEATTGEVTRLGTDVLEDPRQSAVRQLRHTWPALTALAAWFDSIRLYTDWGFGHLAGPREFRPADHPPDRLLETGSNLALVVNELINSGQEEGLNEEFRKFYPRFVRFTVSVFGNQVLLNMHEEGLSEPIPATRWSDGMIRYLSLLAILLHPNPPGLICIDEPELGFHPDILPHLGRLVKSASERTQIIITTHSRQLVDEFTDDPAAVIVCERDFDGATRMERQDAARLDKWLEDYSLGELWEKGEIGGNPY